MTCATIKMNKKVKILDRITEGEEECCHHPAGVL